MKNLKDSILEKLKVDDIILTKEFPIDGTLEDIAKFLEGQEFVRIKSGSIPSIIFNENNKRVFINRPRDLWFADTSEKDICEDNPVFYIHLNKHNKSNSNFSVYAPSFNIVNNNKKEFLEELNKRFGW